MTRTIFITLTAALLSLTSSAAYADDFGVTLRYWLTEESSAGASTITPVYAQKFEDTRVDVPAVTLRWSPDFWDNHDILLSYFELKPETTAKYLYSNVPSPFLEFDILTERRDVELLVRSRAGENFFFYYGLRQYKADVTFALPGTSNIFTRQDWLLAEAGLGTATTISENGRHSLFANVIVGLGNVDESYPNGGFADEPHTDTAHTIDLNLGYQYTMNETTSFSFRYRDFSAFKDGDPELTSAGVDLGVTFNF